MSVSMNRAAHRDRLRNYLDQAAHGAPPGPFLDLLGECVAALDGGRLDVLQGLLAEPQAWRSGCNLRDACMDYARRSLREVWTADLPSRARARVAEWRAGRERAKLSQ